MENSNTAQKKQEDKNGASQETELEAEQGKDVKIPSICQDFCWLRLQ